MKRRNVGPNDLWIKYEKLKLVETNTIYMESIAVV